MVRKERLELSRLAALEPKSSASTNFATSAVFTGGVDAARRFQGRGYSHKGRILAISADLAPANALRQDLKKFLKMIIYLYFSYS